MKKQTTIFAETLFDGNSRLENATIVVEGDRIIDVVKKRMRADISGIVTPAFIDAHSHIGMVRNGEPGGEEEANDHTDQILPLNNALNSVYFDDTAFAEACAFGVLYSCIVPGSGNLLGGRAMVVRNFAKNRQAALVKDYGFKMALGYNPRSTGEWKGSRPNTRMGIYSLLEKRFDQVLDKSKKGALSKERKLKELKDKAEEKKWGQKQLLEEKALIEREAALELDAEEKAILEILEQKRTVKVHVHKEDDVLYLISLVKKYGITVTADHLMDVHHQEIFDALAENNIRAVYGPMGSLPYKVELKHESYKNAALLMKSKLRYGLMTDHPVIMTPMLRDTLKYFLIAGMTEESAIGLITARNAEILGIDNMVGTVAVGKFASLVVWDKSPFHLAAFPRAVMAEGALLKGQA